MARIVGIGCDITECLRVARMVERHADAFLNRVFTPGELHYCQSRKQVTQQYAGHWAAKEAVLRALGTTWKRGIQWREIEIVYPEPGKSTVNFLGDMQSFVAERGVTEVLISIAACHTHATAYAVALGEDEETE